MAVMLWALAGIAAGAPLGHRLAARGVTSANALESRQGVALAVVFAAVAAGASIYFRHRLAWMPVSLGLYGEAWLMTATLFAAGLAFGLLVLLEWPGRRDRGRRARLLFGAIVLALCLGVLGFRTLPVRGILQPSAVVDGDVVIQTTPYTCVPASVATLARWALNDTTVTERTVNELTRTTHAGTTTLQGIRAMRSLGLAPRFAMRLTPDSLVSHGGLALLHVREPVAGRRIRHAVALLAVDPVARTVTLGNPLYGRQIKGFAELEGYWIGEAVFVDTPGEPGR